MRVFLIRHAHAGHRSQDGRDIYRKLSETGHDRATELVETFANHGIDRVLSSPATRCVQTVQALAMSKALEVVEAQELWEGSSIDDAIFAMANANPGDQDSPESKIIACSHGDIIPGVIEALGASGVQIDGRGCELGSVWILDHNDGRWTSARYGGLGAGDLESSV